MGTMRVFGFALMALGVFLLYHAGTFDPTVSAPDFNPGSGLMPDRVVNLQMLAYQLSVVFVGCAAFISGSILFAADVIAFKESETTGDNSTPV